MLKFLLVLLLNKGLLLEIVKVHRLKKDLSPVLAEREVLSNSETSGKGNWLYQLISGHFVIGLLV